MTHIGNRVGTTCMCLEDKKHKGWPNANIKIRKWRKSVKKEKNFFLFSKQMKSCLTLLTRRNVDTKNNLLFTILTEFKKMEAL